MERSSASCSRSARCTEMPRPWVMKPTISSPIGWQQRAMWCIGYQHLQLPHDRYLYCGFAVCSFLLKLFQRGGVLLGTRLIKLRLQKSHHLIETDIPATNRRQQLVDIIEVVTRQQMFFCFFQADPQMFSSSSRICRPPECFCHGPVYRTKREFSNAHGWL